MRIAGTALQEAVNAAELKRIIEGLPLETSAVAAVEWRLGQLEPSQFAALLTELARDNHAFRYFPASSGSPSPPHPWKMVHAATAAIGPLRIVKHHLYMALRGC